MFVVVVVVVAAAAVAAAAVAAAGTAAAAAAAAAVHSRLRAGRHRLPPCFHPSVSASAALQELPAVSVFVRVSPLCPALFLSVSDPIPCAPPPASRGRYTACGVEGLGYLHRLGLTHGNLKPSNMLVNIKYNIIFNKWYNIKKYIV